MNASDAADLLTAAALVDKRTVGEADARMWAEIIPDRIGPKVALEAVKAYYREKRDWIMPADVIAYAAKAAGDAYLKAIEDGDPEDRRIAFHELPTSGHRAMYSRESAEALVGGATRSEAHKIALRAVGGASRATILELTPAPKPASYYNEF